jgi:hypothetical protein
MECKPGFFFILVRAHRAEEEEEREREMWMNGKVRKGN